MSCSGSLGVGPASCIFTSLVPEGMLLTCESILDGPLSDFAKGLKLNPFDKLSLFDDCSLMNILIVIVQKMLPMQTLIDASSALV